MIDFEKMRMSLTKNGFMKLAEVVRRHPSQNILDNVNGTYRGINLAKSQSSKILGVDSNTGLVPLVWDEIRELGDNVIDGCVFIAIILSHEKLVDVLSKNRQRDYRGVIHRSDLSEKEFTNLTYAMACLNLCDYERGSTETAYDFEPLIANLQGEVGLTVRRLIEVKLERIGWVNPKVNPLSGDLEFLPQCHALQLPTVFSQDPEIFDAWMSGQLEFVIPDREFGLSRDLVPRAAL